MKKLLLTSFMAIFCLLAVFAQNPPKRNCGTLLHHDYLKETRPNYENDLNQYNQLIEKYLQDNAADLNVSKTNNTSAIVTIPVVVHVIYRVSGENISDAQAASQVQVLNDDFAKLNTDASKVTQPTFSTVAAGSNIRFCLAQRDPNGNPTTGITHKLTSVTAFSTDDKVKFTAQGGEDAWDVTKYVNIWVCNLGNSLLGYGEFPTSSLSNTWGLVIHYKYTGKNGSAVAPYNLGRTGTHEFGHCFNLYHIWGDDNGACTGSDQCSDTPNQAGEHYGCYTAGSIQTDACSPSSPGVMWMNYMDYTDDACMYMFTAQQCARMEAIVNNPPWNVLQTSLGCTPVSALDAGIGSIIEPINGSSTCNNNITPKITLNNYGSTTLTSATISYKMDATATQTLAWTGSLASSTSTVLTLNTYSGLTNAAHTFSVWVTAPNGGTDENAANDSKLSSFTVVAAPTGSALPFTEGFESTTFPPAGWLLQKSNTISSTNTWTRLLNTTGLTAGSTAIAKMDNYSGSVDISGQKDALRTPPLSFSDANSTLKVKFDVSHRIYSTVDIDTLNVYISTDCGTSWTRLYTKGGSQLATVAGSLTTAYTPTANSQWRRDSISLSAYAGQTSVYLKFENRSGWGNNVYLDNINVSFVASTLAPVANFSMSPTSGCTGNPVQLTDLSTNSPTSWTWTPTPALGVTFSNANAQNPTVTFANPGTYSIALTASNSIGSSSITKTISIISSPTVSATSATICSGNSTTLTASGATTYLWNTGATTASISVSPSITTNYTVVGTTGGCTNTKTVSVTVNATPTVAVSNVTVCGVTTTTLTASGATSYSWSTGATTASISASPSVTTVYTVTGTTGNCSNTKTVSITVKSSPTVTVNSATTCAGSSTVLTASGATTYLWNTGATTPSISVSPSVTTNYTVTGTTSGCSNTKTVSVTVNALPTVVANNATVCAGSSTVITASGATSYSWNTGATTSTISVNPTVNTTYTVVGTNSVGCTNTKTVSVTVNSLPNVTSTSATICAGATGTITASGATTYSWNTGATGASLTASPSSNTTYTVTGISSVGCVKTATGEIVVGSEPSISVNSATICAGSTATLTASGVTSFTWNTGSNASSISVNPTGTMTYTVTGTLTGCAMAATQTATVSVNSLPLVTLGEISGPLCTYNAAVTLSGSPSGGTFSGTGVVGSTFDPAISGAGTFTVMYDYTDGNGCSATDSKTVSVSLCTGIAEITNSTITVYPNPAKDLITVSMSSSLVDHATIEMYDAIGKLVISEKVSNALTTISLTHFSSGMYTIRVVSESRQSIIKVTKE